MVAWAASSSPRNTAAGGVGDGVLQAATDWLRERGVSRARLYVHADNARAQRCCERSGFRPTGARFTGTMGPEIEMACAL